MAGGGGFVLMDPQAFLLSQRRNRFVKTQLNSILRDSLKMGASSAGRVRPEVETRCKSAVPPILDLPGS